MFDAAQLREDGLDRIIWLACHIQIDVEWDTGDEVVDLARSFMLPWFGEYPSVLGDEFVEFRIKQYLEYHSDWLFSDSRGT